MTGSEQVLVEDWCQQYPSHSVGTVEFGPDGALYASAGDGASFNFDDYGQDGSPLNPCGDPPGGVGASQTPPSAEGGALRSQDLRTTSRSGDAGRHRHPRGSGRPAPACRRIRSPGSADANARRIIAHGLRNPFRFTFRPGDERALDRRRGLERLGGDQPRPRPRRRRRSRTSAGRATRGTPGSQATTPRTSPSARTCTRSPSADTKPFFAYHHSDKVVPWRELPCRAAPPSPGSPSSSRRRARATRPSTRGALLRRLLARLHLGDEEERQSDSRRRTASTTFVGGAANPVNLEFGPDGNLYYVDFDGGTIREDRDRSCPATGRTPT